MARPAETRSFEPRDEINPGDRRELVWWADRLHVDPEELCEVIEEVGPRVAAVATELGCVVQPEELQAE
jgi:hypothetical protein